MDLSQVKRAKVRKKRFIHQVIVDAKVEGMSARARRIPVRDPVQASRDNLDRFVFAIGGFFHSLVLTDNWERLSGPPFLFESYYNKIFIN